MPRERDPVEEAADRSDDLYGIATWEVRTRLDRVAAGIYRLVVLSTRFVVVALALLILVGIGGLSALADPQIRVLTALSVIPALALAGYVWWTDETSTEPLGLLVATFLLGVLTANFAAVLNSVLRPVFEGLQFLGLVLFFFLVVGPIEEGVKLLAVRLYAYSKPSFDAVIDGAVYGAVAGLGFATIENALYITRTVTADNLEMGLGLIGVGGGITAVRALAGPGHVIYSAFAGYYLGLAKFNPEHRGPIVVKGLLIAALIHGLYNSTVGIGSAIVAAVTPLGSFAAFVVYVVAYDGLFGFLLLRKLSRYSRALHEARAPDGSVSEARPEATELE